MRILIRYVLSDLLKVFLLVLAALFIFVRNKPKARIFLDLLVGIGFTLFLLATIELVFYYLNQQNQRQRGTVAYEFIALDETPDVQLSAHRRAWCVCA